MHSLNKQIAKQSSHPFYSYSDTENIFLLAYCKLAGMMQKNHYINSYKSPGKRQENTCEWKVWNCQ